MAKSKIIKELVNEEISLSVTLKRLIVLANDLNDIELKTWAEKEVNGYTSTDVLPEYRIIKSLSFYYSGINGNCQVKHLPLNIGFLNKDTLDDIITNTVTEPISGIENKAKSTEGSLMIDRSYLANEVYKNSKQGFFGIQCTSISQEFQPIQFETIVSKVSSRVLEILLKLDNEFGCLDDLDIGCEKVSKKKIDEVKQDIKVIIIEGKAKIKDSNIGTDNSKVDKKKTKTINKNSNTGKGNNYVEKHTDIESEVNIELTQSENKKSWLKRIFKRSK